MDDEGKRRGARGKECADRGVLSSCWLAEAGQCALRGQAAAQSRESSSRRWSWHLCSAIRSKVATTYPRRVGEISERNVLVAGDPQRYVRRAGHAEQREKTCAQRDGPVIASISTWMSCRTSASASSRGRPRLRGYVSRENALAPTTPQLARREGVASRRRTAVRRESTVPPRPTAARR
jgi:hypothetical protein